MAGRKRNEYDASSIKVFQGLEGVRENPSMYIGGTDSHGIWIICKELLDNGVDEAMGGHADTVGMLLAKDGSIYVWDNGRGVPVEIHPDFKKQKMSALTVIYSHLHAGGKTKKDGDSAYEYSVGVHGLGASVTNALSNEFEVCSRRNGRWHHQQFAKGKPTSNVERRVKCQIDLAAQLEGIKTPKGTDPIVVPDKGTVLRFKHDPSVFDKGAKLDMDRVHDWFNTSGYLYAGVNFVLIHKGKVTTYQVKDGLTAFVEDSKAEIEAEAIHDSMFIHQQADLDVAVQWTSHTEPYMWSYVNGSITNDGGTHLNGLYQVITKAFEKHRRARDKFTAADLREGLIGAINLKLAKPSFSSQTKTKLTTAEAMDTVVESLAKPFEKWLGSNKAMVRTILTRANEVNKAREEYKLSKNAASQLRGTRNGRANLPPAKKFAVSMTKDPTKRELYVVEGACWSADTLVRCDDGVDRTFETLAEDFEKGIDHYGYAWNQRQGIVEKTILEFPRVSKETTELVEIEFEDGTKVQCTPDHKWLLKTGKWKEAKDLTPEDELRIIED